MSTMTEINYSPGKNFYLWENHKWLNDPKNGIPADYSLWGSFVKLRDNSLNDQINLLENLKNADDSMLLHEDQLLKYVYNSSMLRFDNWSNNISDYRPVVNELRALENRLSCESHNDYVEALGRNSAYNEKNGIGYFLDFNKGPDLVDSDNVKLDLGPGSTSLPERSYYFDEKHEAARVHFLEHLENVNKIILEDANVDLGKNFVDDVMNFETKLAYISMNSSQSRLYDEYYSKSLFTDIWKNLNSSAFVKGKLNNYKESEQDFVLSSNDEQTIKLFLESLNKELNLTHLLEENYKKNYNDFDQNKALDVCIYDGDYLKRVLQMVLSDDDTIKRQLYNYFRYRIISSLSNYCSLRLHEEFFDFYSRKLNGQQEEQPFDKRSVIIVNSWVGEIMGKLYIREYFSENSKSNIEKMIHDVIHVMEQSLQTNTWLTEPTKQRALKKLSTFNMKIGYPDTWKDYSSLHIGPSESIYEISKKIKEFMFQTEFLDKVNKPVDKTEWHMTPQTVNAYFQPQLNEIVFPAAILQPPFYQESIHNIDMDLNPNQTQEYLGFDPVKAINFGGISAVIAHEITHGYDDQGRKFDENGNMVDWWNKEDTLLFNGKIDMMGEQAEQYTYTDSSGNVHKMKAQLTMGENLADLGGLTLSLRAMLLDKSMVNSDGTPKKDALILFFRSFCNIWKCSMKEELRINRLETDPHAPADYRANLVRNIDEFYTAFDVNENDKMYLPPSKRVRMW